MAVDAQSRATEERSLQIIAVVGAKGGVGTSLLSANLALYLATMGKRVVAVDANPHGANLHTLLGIGRSGGVPTYQPPVQTFGSGPLSAAQLIGRKARAEIHPGPSRELIDATIPGLSLLHGGVDEPYRGASRRSSLRQLASRLRKEEVDCAVFDLGADSDRALTEFWLSADHRVMVTTPEPTAIENMYRFVRAAFAHHVLSSAPDTDVRNQLEEALQQAGRYPAPLDFLRTLEDTPLESAVLGSLQDFEFPFAVSQARLRADLELGDQIVAATRRRYGLTMSYLGYIEHDDTVRSCLRKTRPLLLESPGAKASRCIEKIARRVFSGEVARRAWRPTVEVPVGSHHDFLEVERGATEEEIRRAYKRMCAVFSPGSLATYGLFDEPGLQAIESRIDEAYDVLLDPARRRPYELSLFPTAPETPAPAVDDEQRHSFPPAPVITPETEFTGALLRAVRESQGIDLDQISDRTKVGTNYLRSIEADAFDRLPALVYVRGFVSEFAKFLRLDPEHASLSYARRYKDYLGQPGKM